LLPPSPRRWRANRRRGFREDLILNALEAIEARVGVMAKKLFERERR